MNEEITVTIKSYKRDDYVSFNGQKEYVYQDYCLRLSIDGVYSFIDKQATYDKDDINFTFIEVHQQVDENGKIETETNEMEGTFDGERQLIEYPNLITEVHFTPRNLVKFVSYFTQMLEKAVPVFVSAVEQQTFIENVVLFANTKYEQQLAERKRSDVDQILQPVLDEHTKARAVEQYKSKYV